MSWYFPDVRYHPENVGIKVRNVQYHHRNVGLTSLLDIVPGKAAEGNAVSMGWPLTGRSHNGCSWPLAVFIKFLATDRFGRRAVVWLAQQSTT